MKIAEIILMGIGIFGIVFMGVLLEDWINGAKRSHDNSVKEWAKIYKGGQRCRKH
jgi:hypothetical protein